MKRVGAIHESLGKVVIGTVYGDIHNIGKHMVATQLLASHGYPIHIGDPTEVGVDLMNPDIVNPYTADSPPLPQQLGEICMIWPGTVTHMNVIKTVKSPLAMAAKPAKTFVTDHRAQEFQFSFRT